MSVSTVEQVVPRTALWTPFATAGGGGIGAGGGFVLDVVGSSGVCSSSLTARGQVLSLLSFWYKSTNSDAAMGGGRRSRLCPVGTKQPLQASKPHAAVFVLLY